MAYFTYDTSVCIARKLRDFTNVSRNFRMSAVVLMELITGALDQSHR